MTTNDPISKEPLANSPISHGPSAPVAAETPVHSSMVTDEERREVLELLAEEVKAQQVGKRLSRSQLIFRRFVRNKTAVVGVVGIIFVLFLAIFGHFLTPWDFLERDRTHYLMPPDGEHWFGTNKQGRDMFAMTVEGMRKSLLIGFAVAALQTTVAAIIGSAAAYFGGLFDRIATWIIDLMLVIPAFLILAVVSQNIGGEDSSVFWLIILIAGFGWMLTARVVRALTMSVKSLDYVNAAKYMSVPSRVVIARHIIPNISSLLIIDFTLGVAAAVLSETSLSYFGFGIKDPQVSLGSLIGQGQAAALTHPWMFVSPAIVLVIMLVSVNFIGDGLRDAIDPTSKSGGKA
ncbi:peptide/nickel transport system permease protein [Arcanobacterium pluranimalium]|uniref:ABC transporter permease n=1 Tax=Arcanobacterium pluranimalium TaxID=108028 RepID=UPI001EF78A4F|nr:ABC transporter permease [Arcanobacterium pluranimalium]MBM7824850.1 peptide/nickel transport system permease protein [Arcanobacterium pluranimalium]